MIRHTRLSVVLCLIVLVVGIVPSWSRGAAPAAASTPKFLTLPFSFSPNMWIQQGWYLRETPAVDCRPGNETGAPVDPSRRENCGIDFARSGRFADDIGFRVLAAAPGWACRNCVAGQGNRVLIRHKVDGVTYYTYYGNLASFDAAVPRSGERWVERGQRIGWAGNSGTTGPIHLHFELRTPTGRRDPYNLAKTNEAYPSPSYFSGSTNRLNDFWTRNPPSYAPALSCATPVPRPGQIVFFTDPHYRGKCVVKRIGAYANSAAIGLPDNAISSFVAAEGVFLKLYSEANFAGVAKTIEWPNRVSDLGGYRIGQEGVSSLKVLGVQCTYQSYPDVVTLYELPNYSGRCVTVGIGRRANADEIRLPDNSISSISVGANVRARLYADPNFGGTAQTFLRDDPDLSDDPIGSDTVSSLRVYSPPVAYRIEVQWERDYNGIERHLWLPAQTPYHLTGWGTGSANEFPWASESLSTTRIYKLLEGTYVFAVRATPCDDEDEGCEYIPINATGAMVKLYQGDTLLRTYRVPTQTGGSWWDVFHIDGDGTISDVNEVGWGSPDPYREQVGRLTVDFLQPHMGPIAGGCIEAKDLAGNAFAACDGDDNDAVTDDGEVQLTGVPFGTYALTLIPPEGYKLFGEIPQSIKLLGVTESQFFTVATGPIDTQFATVTIHTTTCPLDTPDPLTTCPNKPVVGQRFYSADWPYEMAQTDSHGIATFELLWPGQGTIYPDMGYPAYGTYTRCTRDGTGELLVDGPSSSGNFGLNMPDGATIECEWILWTAPSSLGVSLSSTRGVVGSVVNITVTGWPPGWSASILWDGRVIGFVSVFDESGTGTTSFTVPASTKGSHTVTARFNDSIAPTAQFEVVPRIKVTPTIANTGDSVSISLRGFAANTTVRIRWKQGTTWVEVARVKTSRTGSAGVQVAVPSWAPDGTNSIRADALTVDGGRAQTNALTVGAGVQAATATPTANPAATQAPAEPTMPTPTATTEPTAQPTATPTEIVEPTATTEVPTSTPTAEATASETQTPTGSEGSS